MANPQLGAAYVSIFPVMKGFRKTITGELGQAGKEGGNQFNSALSGAGDEAGKSLGTKFKAAFTGGTTDLGTATLKALGQNVDQAQAAYSTAMGKMRDEAGKVRVAQTRLNELQESGKATATQLARAEEQVASASRRLSDAWATSEAKARTLAQAQQALATAEQEVAAASTSASETASTGWGRIASSISEMASGLSAKVSPGLENVKLAFQGTFDILSAGALAAGTAIAGGLMSHVDDAISRMDTLNNFPKIMANQYGKSADDAKAATDLISDTLDTLPLTLDGVVQHLQQFAPALNRSGYSAEEMAQFTLAMDEALLASGQDTAQVNAAILQLSQAMARGKMDGQEMNTLFAAMPGTMDKMAQSLLGADATVEDLRSGLKKGEVSMDEFVNFFMENSDELKSDAEDMSLGIGTLLYKLGTGLTKADASIMEPFQEDINNFAVNGKHMIEEAGEGIGAALGNIRNNTNGAGTALSGFSPALLGIAGAAAPLLTNLPIVGSFIAKLGGEALGAAGPAGVLIGMLIGMWTNSENLRNAVGNLIGKVGELIGQLAGGPLGEAINMVGGFIAFLMGKLGDLLAILLNAIGAVLPYVGTLFNAFGEIVLAIGEGFMAVWENVKARFGAFVSAVSSGIETAKAAFHQFKNAVILTIGQAIQTIQTLPTRIKSALSGAKQWLLDTGRNIIQGLINGILEKIGGVGETIRNGVSDAIGGLAGFLGIHSPSTLMAKRIGQPMAMGVAQGVENATPSMISGIDNSLSEVERLAYRVPINYAANINTGTATRATSTGFGSKVVNQTVNVRATDPNSVLAVLESRQRAALGV